MQIKIRQKFIPFSHIPGRKFIVPRTDALIQIFPTKCVLNREGKLSTFRFLFSEPVRQFTTRIHLEKGFIEVFGFSGDQYFCYQIYAKDGMLQLYVLRCSKEGLHIEKEGSIHKLYRKETLTLVPIKHREEEGKKEKLHLGFHKKLQWEKIASRMELGEILPLWMQMGKWVNVQSSSFEIPSLCEIEKKIKQRDRQTIGRAYLDLFMEKFEGVFVPQPQDVSYRGFQNQDPEKSMPAFLAKSMQLIRALFVQKKQDCLFLLPCLPKEIHAGRLIQVPISSHLTLDLEWSKKQIQKVVFYPKQTQDLILQFNEQIRHYRIQTLDKTPPMKKTADASLHLEKGKIYILDRFQK